MSSLLRYPLPDSRVDWPVRPSREFGARRANGARRHAGIDLTANAGDRVVAVAGGPIVAVYQFYGDTFAVMQYLPAFNATVLYGELDKASVVEAGARVGVHREAGREIGRVGKTPGGSSMLHFEVYRGKTKRNKRWSALEVSPPDGLVDPAGWLAPVLAGESGPEPEPGPEAGGGGPSAATVLALASLAAAFGFSISRARS